MSIIFLLIPLSVLIAAGFLVAFIWAVRSGQYEDTCTPAMRLLMQDGVPPGRRGSSRPPAEIQNVASITPLPRTPGSGRADVTPVSQRADITSASIVEPDAARFTPMKLLRK